MKIANVHIAFQPTAWLWNPGCQFLPYFYFTKPFHTYLGTWDREVRASSSSPPWGPNQGLWSPVLLKFCHWTKALKMSKSKPNSKETCCMSWENPPRTELRASVSYGHGSYRKSSSFGMCCIIVVHCWWYLIFPVIKIHLHSQLSSFIPS